MTAHLQEGPNASEEAGGPDEWEELKLSRWQRFFIYTYLTAPGVVIHELGHAIGCILAGVPIVTVGWWTPKDPRRAGYVRFHRHKADPRRPVGFNTVFLALMPFVVPNLIGAWLLWEVSRFRGAADPLAVLLALWIGISAIIHGVPSRPDTNIASWGLRYLRFQVGHSEAGLKLLRLIEYGVAYVLLGSVLLQQRLFISFYGRFAWLAVVWAAMLLYAPAFA